MHSFFSINLREEPLFAFRLQVVQNFNSYKMDKNAESAKMSHEALTTRINTMCCWTRCSFSEILSPF